MKGPSSQLIPCRNCYLRGMPAFRPLEGEELRFVQSMKKGELNLEAGTILFREGDTTPHLYTVLHGWAYRHKDTPEGARQILNFALPGDLIGLQTAIMGKIEHSATALTDVRLCIFERADIWRMFRNHPELSFDLTWIASREERLLDRHLLSLGQRRGLQRIAYLIAHLVDRAVAVGAGTRSSIEAPFRQQHFADALGMTKVHVSRMMAALKAKNLVEWKSNAIYVSDWSALCRLADYDALPERLGRPFI